MSVVFIFDPIKGHFRFENRENPSVGARQILVEQKSIGINEIDLVKKKYIENGASERLQSKNLDSASSIATSITSSQILGYEGCGVVKLTGKEVEHFSVGDRVAYISHDAGCFGTTAVIHENMVVKIPSYINDFNLVASLFFKSCLAHSITARAFVIRKGVTIAIANSRKCTNQVIHQFAKYRNGSVLNIVNHPEDYNDLISIKGSDGIIVNDGNIVTEIMKLSKDRGINAFYDTTDSTLIESATNFLSMFGVLVLRSMACDALNTSCNLENLNRRLNTEFLAKKSLFLTIPSVFHYKNSRNEIVLTGIEIFEMIKNNSLNTKYKVYKFNEIEKGINEFELNENLGIATVIDLQS